MDVPYRGKLRQQWVSTTTVLLPFSGLKTIYVKYKIGGTGMISSSTAFNCFSPARPQALQLAYFRESPSQRQVRA